MADSESSFLDDDDGGGFEFDPEKAFLMEEDVTEASTLFIPEGQEQQAPNSLHYDGSRESSAGSVRGSGTYTVSGIGTYTGTGSGIATGNVFTTTTTSTIANSDSLRFPAMSGSAGFTFPTFGESLPPLARVAMKRKQPDHLTMGDIVMVQPQKGRLANQPTRRFSGTEESSGGGGGSDMEECSNSAPHTPKDQGIPYRIPGSGGSDSSVYSHSSYSSSAGAYASSDTGGTSVYGAYSLFSEAPSFISINGDPGVGQYGSFTDKDEGSHSTLSQHDSPAFAFYPAAQKREALDVRRSVFDPETDTEMQLFCNFDFLEASSPIDITEMEAVDLGSGDNLRAICDDILSTSPPHHCDDEDDNVIIYEGGVPKLHTGISLIMEQSSLDYYGVFQSYQHYQQQESDQTRDITENVMSPKFTPSSSSGGVPLSRKMSSCGIPSPLTKTEFSSAPSAGNSKTNTRNITPFPSLIGEYAPWMSSDANDLVRGVAEPLHQSKFVIRPLSASLESIHNPETPETLAYFPESMRPFQSYSGVDEAFLETDNVPQLDQTTKEEIKNVLERANQERADKKRERSENLAAGGKSRHSFAIKYAQWAASQSLIESTWIRALLVGESIEFEEVSPVGWTIERGIQFCNAVISSIIHDSHFEESLEEFLRQFFLPKVLNPAIKKEDFEAKMIAFSSSSSSSPTATATATSTKYTKTRIEISAQVSRLATEMISNLISPSIFSFFIEFCEPCLTFEDADSLYQALHDTMLVLSIPKSSKKSKSPSIQRPSAPKADDPLYATDQALYSLALAAYVEKLEDYDRELKEISRQRRYREEKIRVRRIHKNRSFYFLKALVTHLPQPINCVDSRWSRGYLLSIPPSTVDEGDEEDEDEEKKTSSEKKKHDRHRKRKSHRNKHGKNDEEKQQLQTPPLATKHENQDFFDALFFAKILRALLVLDDSVFFVQVQLEAFLASFHTEIIDSPLSIRYLRVIDRFMAISRFNVVANVLPRIIDYRRFVLYYLINTGAEHMGVLPVKVFSRSIVLGLASLFEALQLYQLYPTPSHKERTDRLLTLLRTPDLLFHIPIIFVLYNPIDFADIVPIIETALREKTVPTLRLHAYAEIFAMTKNIDLLPLLQRKVLKFTPPVQSASSCGSERDSQAIYDWNMPRRLKNLFEFEKYRSSTGSPIPHHHLQLPSKSDNMGCKLNVSYWNFAARILLARQFGISFDAANFKDQAHENFSWLECIAVVNFFLEREAQTILAGALRPVNPHLYKVFRVIDSQENLHRSTQLPRDEPTHYVNLFINSAFTSLTSEEKAAILNSFNGLDGLFDSIFKATQNTPIKQLLELNPQGKVLLIHRIRNDSQFKWKPAGFSPFIFK